jgi:acyl-CoA reductase-like NAD-dependent aldehyde dehydrogenase
MIELPHFIDGRSVWSKSGETFESINPATGEQIATVAFGTREDIDAAVDSARRCHESGDWRSLAPGVRAGRLRALAALVRERAAEIAAAESADSGKPLRFAAGDVAGAADLLDYFATLPENVQGRVYADSPGYFTHSRREPYGAVGAIAPWNFPFLNAVWKVGAALAVGNCVVLKMAEQTPITTSLLAVMASEVGFPAGALNVVHGDGPTTGAALPEHPEVRKITFTGSTEVGRSILRAAADGIKSVHLELGGKTANIVFADADLDDALEGTLFTGFFNSGQICTAGSRLLVEEAIADEFLARVTERVAQLRIGDPVAEGTDVGPLVSDVQRARVEEYIADGIAAGASVAVGGGRPAHISDAGYFVEPTVLTDVAPDMRVAREEIFGPVITVTPFRDVDEAVAIANAIDYGLAATVWTTTLGCAMEMTDRLDAGIVWTNCPHHLVWNAPYEGHKTSGLGEDLGLEAISTFTELKISYMRYRAPPSGGHSHRQANDARTSSSLVRLGRTYGPCSCTTERRSSC